MAKLRWPYWGRFAALAAASLTLLFTFVFGFLPRRFLLELDFSESGYAFHAARTLPPVPPPVPAAAAVRRPVPRGPAERFWDAYLSLARAGDDSAALVLLTEYMEAYPEDLAVTLERARTLWRLGRLDAAAADYRRALALGAGPEVKRELAQLRVAAGRWDDALAIFEALARAAPRDTSLLREFAETATQAERYERAIELYGRLVELAPGDPELRLQLARVLYWSNRLERAAQTLKGVPEGVGGADVDSLRALVAAALAPPPAAEFPDTAAAPTLSELERARELASAGAADSALALYRRYLIENPGADSVLLEMADVYEFRADDPESAMALLRTYLGRHPDAQDVRLRLARLLAWSGRLVAATATADSIVRADAENAAVWALLGDLHRWRGDRDLAARAYRRALALDPAAPGAAKGLAALRAEVDAALAAEGRIGPTGRIDYFNDSDDFSLARWRGGWSFGSPRTRAGLEATVESLRGRDLTGRSVELTAGAVEAGIERWWLQGELETKASVGLWVPEAGVGVPEVGVDPQPILSLSLAAPDWRGASYRFEYRHGPAYRETSTLETAVVDLRIDAAEVGYYRPVSRRWDLAASVGVTRFAGADDANLRADATLGLLFRPRGGWALGYETEGLGFADPAPKPGRRLYWDPEWFWSHSAVVGWSGEPAAGWQLGLRATPGVAWLRERGTAPSLAGLFGATVEAQRRWQLWTLEGRAGFTQSRAGSQRAFSLELALTRRFRP